MSRWRAALPRLEKRNGLTPPSVNIQPSCPACDIFHDQNDTYPDLSVHLRRETYVGKRIAKGDSTCGQDRCLGSHGDGRKRSRLEATLRVCAVTILGFLDRFVNVQGDSEPCADGKLSHLLVIQTIRMLGPASANSA